MCKNEQNATKKCHLGAVQYIHSLTQTISFQPRGYAQSQVTVDGYTSCVSYKPGLWCYF